eukprot:6196405-Pleurochrysis_carterae.AAC.1
MGFGGAFAPNRFERLSTLVAAWAQRRQAQLDATQPPPEAARLWARARSDAGVRGDAAQLAPRYLQVYIDDFTGMALADEVVPPPQVAATVIDPAHTRAAGGVPSPRTSRVHVHAQLAVLALAELGLHAAPAKVLVGDAVNALGFHVSARSGRLSCPDSKRRLLLAAMAEMRAETAERGRVHWRRARTLAGRLANLAQVFPELKAVLRGAYAVSQPAPRQRERGGGGWRQTDEWRPLASGGAAEAEWLACLDVAGHVLHENEG